MHRHSGGHRRDSFFAEIQYRGQRPSICESEKRDASGCLRKVLRLPRSVFSRSSCPKLTPHISTVFVHDGAISSKKLSWHIPSWHASRVGLRSAPRRGGIPGGARPRDRAPSCAAAFLRAPSWMRQGVRRMRVRQGFVGQESGDLPHERLGVSSSVATKAGAGGALAEIALGNRIAALLPSSAESTRPSCAAKAGRDCLRRRSFASSWLRSAVLSVILSIEQIEQTMRETTRQAKPNPSTIRGGTCGHPD